MTDTLPTQNEGWGFYGTIAQAGIGQNQRLTAWALASRQIADATHCSPAAVRAFLDSRYGRHFADQVTDHFTTDGMAMPYAIEHAIAKWMAWRISRQTSKTTGIPAGLPHLTGYVQHASIEAEAE